MTYSIYYLSINSVHHLDIYEWNWALKQLHAPQKKPFTLKRFRTATTLHRHWGEGDLQPQLPWGRLTELHRSSPTTHTDARLSVCQRYKWISVLKRRYLALNKTVRWFDRRIFYAFWEITWSFLYKTVKMIKVCKLILCFWAVINVLVGVHSKSRCTETCLKVTHWIK